MAAWTRFRRWVRGNRLWRYPVDKLAPLKPKAQDLIDDPSKVMPQVRRAELRQTHGIRPTWARNLATSWWRDPFKPWPTARTHSSTRHARHRRLGRTCQRHSSPSASLQRPLGAPIRRGADRRVRVGDGGRGRGSGAQSAGRLPGDNSGGVVPGMPSDASPSVTSLSRSFNRDRMGPSCWGTVSSSLTPIMFQSALDRNGPPFALVSGAAKRRAATPRSSAIGLAARPGQDR
jgi:hypothetical protein